MLLEVRNLTVRFGSKTVVDGVSFDLEASSRLGIIGESGSGKTLTTLAIIGLLPETAKVSGSVTFEGKELLGLADRDFSAIRGNRIGMVFQEPLTALNPLMRVGKQIAQPLRNHQGVTLKEGLKRAMELCARVGLPDPDRIIRSYPHQLSGGQRQRIGLAIALACSPALLIADEPTTALDVTVQKEVLSLMNSLVAEEGSSLIFVSHDLPVVASITERVAVMQNGEIVELASVNSMFQDASHEYSRKLIQAARTSDAEFGHFTESPSA
ncbi:MAG: ABC transporter ATP-binding protein [Ilumatobacteraceae bacterium]